MNKRAIRQLFGLAAAALVVTASLSGSASAQTSGSDTSGTPISVGPAVLDATIDAGGSTTRTFNVTSMAAEPITVKTTTHSLVAGNTKLPDSYRNRLDASTWITNSPSSFVLQPNETKEVTATFSVPADAEAGGHYASILVSPQLQNEPNVKGTSAKVFGQVSIAALITINGEVKPKLTATDVVAVKRFNSASPITFEFTLKNTGNVHLFPSAIELSISGRGHVVQKLQAPTSETSSILLPGTTKHYKLTWDDLPGPGWYKAKALVNYGSSSDSQALLIDSNRFYVFPIAWMIAIGIGIVLAIGLIVKLILKRKRKKKTYAK